MYIHFHNLDNYKPSNVHHIHNMSHSTFYNQWHSAPLLYMCSERYTPSPHNQSPYHKRTQPPHTPLLPNKILQINFFSRFPLPCGNIYLYLTPVCANRSMTKIISSEINHVFFSCHCWLAAYDNMQKQCRDIFQIAPAYQNASYSYKKTCILLLRNVFGPQYQSTL